MKKLVIALIAAAAACAAQAGTLQKIKTTASVTMGVRESSGALSYTIGSGKYVGFHIDLCHRALADIQKQLGLPKLDIQYQTVSSGNRIPLLQNGTIDLECGSTTNNATRSSRSRSPSRPTWKKSASP